MLVDKTLREFTVELASSSPAPGGGSVAAICGSLSAALTAMVSNLTIGKEKYSAYDNEMKAMRSESEQLRIQLLSLVDEDTEAFNKVMAAFKLPKGSNERKAALQGAFKGAASVPMRTAHLCYRSMELASVAAKKGNKNSITDAAVAALVAHAGLQGALLNVRINLSSIKDGEFVSKALAEAEALAGSSSLLMEKLMNDINSRI